MIEVEIVNTAFSDSTDETIVSCAIHNTCRPIWTWAEQNNIEITIREHTIDNLNMYGVEYKLKVSFENHADAALFKLTFGTLFPYRSLKIESDLQAYFC